LGILLLNDLKYDSVVIETSPQAETNVQKFSSAPTTPVVTQETAIPVRVHRTTEFQQRGTKY